MAAYEKAGETDEWHTPRYIFDALEMGMGPLFDLDVASPPGGPRHHEVEGYFTRADDGLLQGWYGTVWMNPPFGHQSTKRKWLQRFVDHGNGIALLPDRTSAPWWQEFAPKVDAICFVSPKVKFERPDGTLGESPGTGTCLFSMGYVPTAKLLKCGLGVTIPLSDIDMKYRSAA
jgi:hypothetical protein